MTEDLRQRTEQNNPATKKGLSRRPLRAEPFECVRAPIATILSAQCTDKRVNIVTEVLFRKYRGPRDYIEVSQEDLELDIHSTGFFRNKAKNIKNACARLNEIFEGQIPQTMEELLTLDGVARKTANVVLGNAFGIASGSSSTHTSRDFLSGWA